MFTEYLRDQCFTTAWFGLMTMVWFGWAQEDPPRSWRGWLGAGSVLGVILFGLFLFLTVRNWGGATALEGKYAWFGVLTAIEVVVALVGAIVLWRRGRKRWMAWWVAFVVALHFVPLGWVLLDDVSIVAAGIVQAVLLVALLPMLRRAEYPTSRVVGPVMGGTLLLYALVSGALVLARGEAFA